MLPVVDLESHPIRRNLNSKDILTGKKTLTIYGKNHIAMVTPCGGTNIQDILGFPRLQKVKKRTAVVN